MSSADTAWLLVSTALVLLMTPALGFFYAGMVRSKNVITAALISGAIVERMRFVPYLAFVTAWSLAVYAPVAQWVWGGGWLSRLGALDFAGGTVVHVNAAVAAQEDQLAVTPVSEALVH